MCTGVEIALIAAAVGGTAAGMEESRKSASQQKDANEQQMNAQKAADADMRRQKFREERVKRAQILQFAEGTGASASSGVEGATSSLGTQVGSSVAFQFGQQQAAQDIGAKRQDAADSAFKSQLFGTVGNLATSAFTQTDTFKSIFAE